MVTAQSVPALALNMSNVTTTTINNRVRSDQSQINWYSYSHICRVLNVPDIILEPNSRVTHSPDQTRPSHQAAPNQHNVVRDRQLSVLYVSLLWLAVPYLVVLLVIEYGHGWKLSRLFFW